MCKLVLCSVLVGLLAGCAGGPAATGGAEQLRSAPRSVADYFKDAELRSATRAACSADTEAQYDAYAQLPACHNAAKADHLVATGRSPT